MRRSLGRLTAAGIAIMIGTAFVAVTLIAGAVITRTSYDAVSASLADADLVLLGSRDQGLSAEDVDAVRETDGVAAVDGHMRLWTELSAGTKHAYPDVTTLASDPRLDPQVLLDGRAPERSGEIVLPDRMAERLGVEVGDTVTTERSSWVPADAADADGADGADTAATDGADSADSADGAGAAATDVEGEWVTRTERLEVVGLNDDPTGAFAQTGGAVVVHPEDAERWALDDTMGAPVQYTEAVVALDADADLESVRGEIEAAAPEGAVLRTKDEHAQAKTAELTNGADVFTTIVLGFASIALLVAALVIANTFQVLVAQRTRTLALLRCVGADKRQLRRSVLIEATILGATASAVGLALGIGLAQLTLTVLGGVNLDVPLPATVSVTAAAVIAPLVVGTLVTVVAALAPARGATRVAPLAALRPADAPALTQRRNLPRLVIASLLTVAGVGLLLFAVIGGREMDEVLALGVGVLGGALSFVGVLVGAVFWIPKVVSLTGAILGGRGTSAKLAAANTLRNPRRTAATSTALLIGVTLVAMMSTGAASARTTLTEELASEFPVDVLVWAPRSLSAVAEPTGPADDTSAPTVLDQRLADELDQIDGTAQVQLVTSIDAVVTVEGAEATGPLRVLPAPAARGVLLAPDQAEGLDEDSVIVSQGLAEVLGVESGDVVSLGATTLDRTGGTVPTGESVERTAVVTEFGQGFLATPGTLEAMGVDATPNEMWLRMDADADPVDVVSDIQDALDETTVSVAGAALERVMFQRVIDTLLAVVVGLLGAAVVIALIGVANTLSLSVIERRRESATLRAIGLSKAQLRGTLAIEGALIAGVGAVLGSVLGLLYGWAGAVTVLGVMGDVRLTVPWRDLALVLVVALGAGLLASVLPGRAAARTSPVEALAVD
ncbi:ABC transporter permease [Actinotalea subterranea]|uniref:ABC transporter permease n=1 Tax=Actinotalea subterranea TaxID=2607497 RepID=UPI001FE6408F|nr:FtsX-like permease family protein [Actinotalea subterranea]